MLKRNKLLKYKVKKMNQSIRSVRPLGLYFSNPFDFYRLVDLRPQFFSHVFPLIAFSPWKIKSSGEEAASLNSLRSLAGSEI